MNGIGPFLRARAKAGLRRRNRPPLPRPSGGFGSGSDQFFGGRTDVSAEASNRGEASDSAVPSEGDDDTVPGGKATNESARIKAGISDHCPGQGGEWKIKRGAEGTVSWYNKSNGLGYRIGAGPELSSPATEQASEVIKKDAAKISAGYFGIDAGGAPAGYVDIDGMGNFALPSEYDKPLTELTDFAEEFMKLFPTN